MPGKITIKLPDGTEYDYMTTTAELTNIMSSEKTINMLGETKIEDKTNGYSLRVIFDSREKKRNQGGVLGGFFKKDAAKREAENRRDLTRVEITKNGELVS